MEQRVQNLTKGNIYKTLAVFALPYLMANFIQALYGAVDMMVVGWFNDAAVVAAVSIGTQMMQIVISFVAGLTMGGTIIIAQYYGGGREKDTVETISTMLTLFAIAALLMTLALFLLAAPFLGLLKTPAESFASAMDYVRICACGIFFIFGYNALAAMLRGLGDSKSPLYFIAAACVFNIVFDLLLVGGLKMGAAGAALATAGSQGVSMILAIVYLNRKSFIFKFKKDNFRIYRDKAERLLKVGIPVSLQETLLQISFLFITAIINTMGVVAAAAVGIAGKFDAFAMLPASAFSGAIAAIAAQNIGAGQPDRAKKSLFASIVMSLLCSIPFFIWAQVFPASVLQIFRAEPAVISAGTAYLRTFSIDFMLVAFGFCFLGFFNGCGRTAFSMVNGVAAALLVRLPLAWILSVTLSGSLMAIGLAAPAATLVSVVAEIIYLRLGRWKTPVV